MTRPRATPAGGTHRERLRVPLSWWLLGLLFVGSLWLALVAATPPEVAWGVAAGALLVLAAGLLAYGRAAVVVADGELRAGRAHIATDLLGPARALDRDEARHRAGPGADARAYLLLRPYLRRAVVVEVRDPADPTPYWLIGTRHPARLAAALGAVPGPDERSAPNGRPAAG